MDIARKLTLTLVIVLLATPLFPGAAQARDLYDDEIVFGGSYTLADGEILDGNLLVFGGSATLERDSLVNGDVLLVGGSLVINGEVAGNIGATGGSVSLQEEAVVRGSVSMFGGNLDQEQGAVIMGEVITEPRGPFQFTFPGGVRAPDIRVRTAPLWALLRYFFSAFALAALAILLVMFWPTQAGRVSNSVVAQPLIAGSLGLITLVVGLVLLVAMAITLILIPASFLGAVILVVMVAFGWISLGLEVGRRLERAFNQEWPLPVSAGLGTLLLTLVVNSFGFIFCIGWLAPFAISVLGLGGVLLTRFGTRPYPGYTVGAPPLPPAPPATPPPAGPWIQAEIDQGERAGLGVRQDAPQVASTLAAEPGAGEGGAIVYPARETGHESQREDEVLPFTPPDHPSSEEQI